MFSNFSFQLWVFVFHSVSLCNLQRWISYSMMDIYNPWSTPSLSFSALSKNYWNLLVQGKFSKPYLKFFWASFSLWQCFLTQGLHQFSHIFLARYWSLGWLFETTTGIAGVFTWSFNCMNCFRGLLLIVTYTAAPKTQMWMFLEHLFSSYEMLSWKAIFGFIFCMIEEEETGWKTELCRR